MGCWRRLDQLEISWAGALFGGCIAAVFLDWGSGLRCTESAGREDPGSVHNIGSW